jgi:hypothetical protein
MADQVLVSDALEPVVDPAGWTRDDLERGSDWIFELTPAHVAEIDDAVAGIEAGGLDIMDIRRGDMPLATLGPALDGVREELVNGRGLAVIRGVPVERYTRLQSAIAFWGIGTYIGVPVSQNAKGHLLGHVQDLGGTSLDNPKNRGYQTHDTLPFHSDSCDVVALLCLHTAKTGGRSAVVSSITLYNEMLKRRSDLVAELTRPLYRDRRHEVPEGKDPWFQLPVFNHYQGLLTTNWQGGYIRSAQRFEELPRFTPELAEALDVITGLMHELCFKMDLQPGDLQLLHNHVALHSRTEFEDYPEPERKRHLLRLWLATPEGRPLPAGYFDRYAHLEKGQRPAGGIVVPGTVLKAPLEAE